MEKIEDFYATSESVLEYLDWRKNELVKFPIGNDHD